MSDEFGPSERVIDFDGRDAARDGEQVKDAEIHKARHRRLVLMLLNDPDGRDWLWGLINEFGAFEMRFAASPTGFPDPQATLYYRGRHSAGWRIWTELDDVSPELASMMRREHR